MIDGGGIGDKDKQRRKRERDREAAASASGMSETADAPMVTFAYDANGTLLPTSGPTAAPSRSASGRSRGSSGRSGQSHPPTLAYDPSMTNAEVFAALLAEHQLLEEPTPVAVPLDQRIIPPTVEGPAVISQPPWPSFMDTAPRFEQVQTRRPCLPHHV